MPRPTAAQFLYGSAAVVASTIAMLLLSQTGSGAGVAVIATAALALGLLVALTAAAPRGRGRHAARAGSAADGRPGAPTVTEVTPVPGPEGTGEDTAATARGPEPRAAAAEQPVHH
ncbi:hypothetical protein HYE82_18270 [Streptomyces sp. BR123]|uniref:hypothetical protein n=1 Tax=Streptomyces sp. BR123 TaxID=2749828 RepID=UPI0015C468CD|nr:hypothetical protein [Streptomyces sp. BR123]NXY96297.1 hypothetical protein [Streptomyces sp. BR123]